jgi:hypothetical protein
MRKELCRSAIFQCAHTSGMRVTQEFFGTRIVDQLILGRQPSLVYYVDPWGLPWCCVGLT